MKIYAGSIDLNKIDKSRIVLGKDGAKYYNIGIVVNDEKDKYGNECAITTGQTKEERESKEKRTYIGNAKEVWSSNNAEIKPADTPKQTMERQSINDNDSLPF